MRPMFAQARPRTSSGRSATERAIAPGRPVWRRPSANPALGSFAHIRPSRGNGEGAQALTDVVRTEEELWDEEALVVHVEHLVCFRERLARSTYAAVPVGSEVGQDVFLHDRIALRVDARSARSRQNGQGDEIS